MQKFCRAVLRPDSDAFRFSCGICPAADVSGVKYITTQELFALFPGRPIALIGKPGRQQVIFLDEIARADRP